MPLPSINLGGIGSNTVKSTERFLQQIFNPVTSKFKKATNALAHPLTSANAPPIAHMTADYVTSLFKGITKNTSMGTVEKKLSNIDKNQHRTTIFASKTDDLLRYTLPKMLLDLDVIAEASRTHSSDRLKQIESMREEAIRKNVLPPSSPLKTKGNGNYFSNDPGFKDVAPIATGLGGIGYGLIKLFKGLFNSFKSILSPKKIKDSIGSVISSIGSAGLTASKSIIGTITGTITVLIKKLFTIDFWSDLIKSSFRMVTKIPFFLGFVNSFLAGLDYLLDPEIEGKTLGQGIIKSIAGFVEGFSLGFIDSESVEGFLNNLLGHIDGLFLEMFGKDIDGIQFSIGNKIGDMLDRILGSIETLIMTKMNKRLDNILESVDKRTSESRKQFDEKFFDLLEAINPIPLVMNTFEKINKLFEMITNNITDTMTSAYMGFNEMVKKFFLDNKFFLLFASESQWYQDLIKKLDSNSKIFEDQKSTMDERAMRVESFRAGLYLGKGMDFDRLEVKGNMELSKEETQDIIKYRDAIKHGAFSIPGTAIVAPNQSQTTVNQGANIDVSPSPSARKEYGALPSSWSGWAVQ